MVTTDEQRALQREKAEADAKVWAGLHDKSAEMATGQRGIAALASGKAAELEALAKDAAEKAAAAKDRLDRLAKGEDVTGGLGKPVDFEKVLTDAGWCRDDINFSAELARLCQGREDLFNAFVEDSLKLRERRHDGKSGGLVWFIKGSPLTAIGHSMAQTQDGRIWMRARQ